MTIRVVVADDQVLVRSGFTMLLASEPDIEVVGEAINGAEAVALAASEHPDVTFYAAAVDPELDDRSFIVPGLGDAGDRLYGTL